MIGDVEMGELLVKLSDGGELTLAGTTFALSELLLLLLLLVLLCGEEFRHSALAVVGGVSSGTSSPPLPTTARVTVVGLGFERSACRGVECTPGNAVPVFLIEEEGGIRSEPGGLTLAWRTGIRDGCLVRPAASLVVVVGVAAVSF